MKKAQVVSFHCVLKDRIGNIISSTFNHDVITHVEFGGGALQGLQGLADGLQNLKKGERRSIFLPADKAFGFYDPQLVMELPRKTFEQGQSLQVGHQIQTRSESGDQKMFKVIRATSDLLTLDGNHPLAGQDLVFEIETVDAREASNEEMNEAAVQPSKALLH